MQARILRLPEVMTRTGLSRSTIYLRMEGGQFPDQIALGGRAVGWIESEIQDWIQCQIDACRSNQQRSQTAADHSHNVRKED